MISSVRQFVVSRDIFRYNSNTTMSDELRQEPSDQQRVRRVFVERVITLALTSFGLVAALAWNEAIQALVKEFFPDQQGIVPKFVYALVITFVLVVVSIRLGRTNEQ